MLANFTDKEIFLNVPIVVYHDIAAVSTSIHPSTSITPELFEVELKYLDDHGFNSISFAQLRQALAGDFLLPHKPIIISFDDAKEGQYRFAFSLLRKYNYTATFFPWTSMLDTPGFLSWRQLQEFADYGMEIGGHSASHLHLSSIHDEDIVAREIIQDKILIESRLNKSIEVFAYPYGEQNERVIQQVKDAGYKIARGTKAGVRHNARNLFSLSSIVLGKDFNQFIDVLQASESSTKFDPLKERRLWERTIKAKGAERAYQEFLSLYKHMPDVDGHARAHIFGLVLYEQMGDESIGVCDDSFVYGCYHSVLAKALAQKGLAVLDGLDSACKKTGRDWLGCLHGIGHGLISFLSYEQEGLLEALEACKNLSWKGTVGGCTGGVFMEYNFRTMLDEGRTGNILRPLRQDLHEPCSSLPREYLPACYYEQPDWWRHIFSNDFQKVRALCLSLSEELEEKCLIGMGRVIAQSVSYDIQKTSIMCDNILPAKTVFCRAGGFLSIVDHTHDAIAASAICQLPERDRRKCLEGANIFGAAGFLID